MKIARSKWTPVAVLGLLCLMMTSVSQAQDKALRLDLVGPLGVATSEYIINGIETAAEQDAGLVIIRMDTPGGLVEPMRDIVQAILNSEVPVATYVSPGGARADSAGTYILLASHVAAMAPTTHLGAATPVSLTGGESDAPRQFPGIGTPQPPETDEPEDGVEATDDTDTGDDVGSEPAPREPDSAMGRKVLNDAVAYIRGLAERHGRNADWAERAVRDAATLTAAEALEESVIDLVATNEAELLREIDGREVNLRDAAFVLQTADLTVEAVEPSWRIKFLSTIANPQIALLLLLVGVYGLLFEGYNPGAIVPGVVGVVCLLMAAYALQVIPVNYAGLALIIVGILLIVAEAFVPSFGALGVGGIAAFIVGSIIMFDSGIPGFGVSVTFVVSFGVISGLALLWLVTYLVKLRQRGAVSGRESIVGGVDTAMEAFTGEGRIWLESEAWHAHSAGPVQKDQDVEVIGMDGLTLIVRPVKAPASAPQTQST